MEISGKILREVEFRDRLRGYDTDEVDEFLEKVAVAVDELRSRLIEASERPAPSEAPVAQVEDSSAIADDTIRRTLLLAQRAADLATKEAEDHASRVLDDARTQAAALVAQAEETARQVREDSEEDLRVRVGRLDDERVRLERELETLQHLVEGERERVTSSLSSALQFIEETVTMSESAASAVSNFRGASGSYETPYEAPRVTSPAPGAPVSRVEDDVLDLPDVEAEISMDAATARGETPAPKTNNVDDLSSGPEGDDELWARWTNSSPLEDEDGGSAQHTPFSFDDPTGPRSA